MRSDVERLRPDLLELARAELDSDPFERIEEGTHFAQPAIYCASLAGWSLVDRDDVSCMAGHSLGEFSALVAAGVMSELDGLRLVALRGRLMHEAEQGGGMMAVGTPVEIAAELAGRFGLTVANDNAPEQVVLTGDGDAVDAAVEHAKAEGLRATRLRVSGAFHSPAMGSAALAVPATVVENAPIAERLGVEEEWIEVRTGIKRRHALAEGERLSDIAGQAGALALADAGIDPASVDLLLVATTSQDETTPNSAPLVATEIGAVNAATIDIGA